MENLDLSEAKSQLPAIRKLLEACQKVVNQELSPDEFAGEFPEASRDFEQLIEYLKEYAKEPINTPAEVLIELENQMEQVKLLLHSFISTANPELLEQGMELLLKVSRVMDTVIHELELALTEPEPSGELICVFCGEKNPLSARYCGKCRAILPKPLGETAPAGRLDLKEQAGQQTELSPSSLEILKLAGQRVQIGEISLEDYTKILEAMEFLIQTCRDQNKNLRSEKPDQLFTGAKKLLQEAIELYSQAVDEMKQYRQEQNPGQIGKGLELAEKADEKLAQLQQLTALKENPEETQEETENNLA